MGPGSGRKGRWQILNQVRRWWDLATLKRAVNRGVGHRIIRHADETLKSEHRMSAGKKQTLQFGKVFDKTQTRWHQQMCEHRRGKNSYILILWQTQCQTRAVRFCASLVLWKMELGPGSPIMYASGYLFTRKEWARLQSCPAPTSSLPQENAPHPSCCLQGTSCHRTTMLLWSAEGRGQGDHLSPTPVSRETDELLQEASLLSSYGKFENCIMLVCIIRF